MKWALWVSSSIHSTDVRRKPTFRILYWVKFPRLCSVAKKHGYQHSILVDFKSQHFNQTSEVHFRGYSLKEENDGRDVQLTSQMPYIQSPCSVSLGQLISMDLMVTVTLFISQTFFLFRSQSQSITEDTEHSASRYLMTSDQTDLQSVQAITVESQDNPQDKSCVSWAWICFRRQGSTSCLLSQSKLPLSGNMKTKALVCVGWQRCHLQRLQNIDEWPPVFPQVCTLVFPEMIKDNAWLLYFLLPVHSNVMQSFLLKHEAPQSLLLKTCLREVNIEANATYERKTSSMYFVLNHR